MLSNLIVVTDLDGTLLDHHNYDYAQALPALQRLNDLSIELIINSSKTAAEIQPIRASLHNHSAFIVENGAAVYMPATKSPLKESFKIVDFGMKRADVLNVVHKLREEHNFNFIGFADMSCEELILCTGLSQSAALLAMRRDYSEPVIWQDSEERFDEFVALLVQHKLSASRGGRFTLIGAPVNKGIGLSYLKEEFLKTTGQCLKVIALGDGENDVAMLESADYPVLVKSPVNPFPEVKHDNVLRTDAEGPTGWNEAVLSLLSLMQM